MTLAIVLLAVSLIINYILFVRLSEVMTENKKLRKQNRAKYTPRSKPTWIGFYIGRRK